MNHKRKSLTALAVLTASALCVPVAAAFADSTTVTGDSPLTSSANITGTITPTQITATVPTTASFGIDPWQSSAGSQIVSQSDSFNISNGSSFPVYARITNVAIATGEKETVATDASLVQTAPASSGQVQLAIKNASEAAPSFSTPGDWLMAGAHPYSITTSDKIDAKKAGADTVLGLKIYGLMDGDGWVPDNTFTVTPTFTIQATPFTS